MQNSNVTSNKLAAEMAFLAVHYPYGVCVWGQPELA